MTLPTAKLSEWKALSEDPDLTSGPWEALYGVDAVLKRIRQEYDQAKSNWPPFNSAHEGLAVLEEEVHELRLHVYTNQKRRDLGKMQAEAIQVAAMALRFAAEVCDETRGRK